MFAVWFFFQAAIILSIVKLVKFKCNVSCKERIFVSIFCSKLQSSRWRYCTNHPKNPKKKYRYSFKTRVFVQDGICFYFFYKRCFWCFKVCELNRYWMDVWFENESTNKRSIRLHNRLNRTAVQVNRKADLKKIFCVSHTICTYVLGFISTNIQNLWRYFSAAASHVFFWFNSCFNTKTKKLWKKHRMCFTQPGHALGPVCDFFVLFFRIYNMIKHKLWIYFAFHPSCCLFFPPHLFFELSDRLKDKLWMTSLLLLLLLFLL